MRLAAAGLLLAASVFSPVCFAQIKDDASETVWTGIIPDAFPGEVCTWTLKPDFT